MCTFPTYFVKHFINFQALWNQAHAWKITNISNDLDSSAPWPPAKSRSLDFEHQNKRLDMRQRKAARRRMAARQLWTFLRKNRLLIFDFAGSNLAKLAQLTLVSTICMRGERGERREGRKATLEPTCGQVEWKSERVSKVKDVKRVERQLSSRPGQVIRDICLLVDTSTIFSWHQKHTRKATLQPTWAGWVEEWKMPKDR